MRKLVFDEINRPDMDRIREYLAKNAVSSDIEGLYWVELHNDLLDQRQSVHHACQPYRFAIELTQDAVCMEMLIRSKTTLRCDCIRYANALQRDFILRFADTLIEECEIRT
jgi:hypothetical protein